MTTSRARSIDFRAATIESSSAESVVFPLRRIPAVSTKRYSPPAPREAHVDRVARRAGDLGHHHAVRARRARSRGTTSRRSAGPRSRSGAARCASPGSRSDGSTRLDRLEELVRARAVERRDADDLREAQREAVGERLGRGLACRTCSRRRRRACRARGAARASRSSSGSRPATPSRTKRMRSASATAASARSLVHAAKPPAASRSSPPVSTSV